MTLDDAEALLMNWGRWAQEGEPICLAEGEQAACAISPIFEYWLPTGDARDAGWGDESAPEGMADPIDQRSAEATDRVVQALQARHKRWLVRMYVHRHYVHWPELQAAQRAFLYRLDDDL